MSIPVIGKSDQPNNPLLLLANVMERVIEPLREIAANTRPDASAVLPHRYAVTVVQDPSQGKVWGSFCLACTSEADEFIYPCKIEPDEPIKPPAFFTVDGVFEPDHLGRLLRINDPS